MPAPLLGSAGQQPVGSTAAAAGQQERIRTVAEYNAAACGIDYANQLHMAAAAPWRWARGTAMASRLPSAMAAGG